MHRIIVTGAYKPTYNWEAPHCNPSDFCGYIAFFFVYLLAAPIQYLAYPILHRTLGRNPFPPKNVVKELGCVGKFGENTEIY